MIVKRLGLGAVLVAALSATLMSGCSNENSAKKEMISAGKQLAADKGCVGCHGQNGEGVAAFPRLAGLNEEYVLKQLEDYARELPAAGVNIDPIARDYTKTPRVYSDLTVFSPSVRQDPVMSPIAQGLTEEDMKNLAAYFSSLSFVAKPVEADFQTLERGEDLALRGKPEYGVPGCVSCHAPGGIGFERDFPPLAGQPASYIIEQINRWQVGKRDNDVLGLMRAVANNLTDADKVNVAAYYSNLSYEVNTKK